MKDLLEWIDNLEAGPWRLIAVMLAGIIVLWVSSADVFPFFNSSTFEANQVLLGTIAFITLFATIAMVLLAIRQTIAWLVDIARKYKEDQRALYEIVHLSYDEFAILFNSLSASKKFILSQPLNPHIRTLIHLQLAKEITPPLEPKLQRDDSWVFEIPDRVYVLLQRLLTPMREPKTQSLEQVYENRSEFFAFQQKYLYDQIRRLYSIQITAAIVGIGLILLVHSMFFPGLPLTSWTPETLNNRFVELTALQERVLDWHARIDELRLDPKVSAETLNQMHSDIDQALTVNSPQLSTHSAAAIRTLLVRLESEPLSSTRFTGVFKEPLLELADAFQQKINLEKLKISIARLTEAIIGILLFILSMIGISSVNSLFMTSLMNNIRLRLLANRETKADLAQEVRTKHIM